MPGGLERDEFHSGKVTIRGGSTGLGLAVDAVPSAQIGIDYAHHEVHEGDHYYIEGYTTLGVDGTFYVKLVTPASTKWAHFLWAISSSGVTITTLDEGATGGMADGSNVVPLQSNRNSATASGLVITSGVTIADSYTKRISNAKWGAAGKFDTSGGRNGRGSEIILKSNTTYLRSFTSETDANIIQFSASWYEHTSVS